MFGKPGNRAKAYADTGRESDINTASPHRLIVLLFEGAETAINVAKVHAEQGNIAGRGANLSKAIEIISNGLKVSLDMEQGGELAARLAALYDYMVSRLLWANMKNDIPAMKEVLTLLGEIHGAWEQIDPSKQQQ
ncbi:MAG: flagellar export chaperone FliS [Betaproteobacteria bacterium]|nr:flagellar export chaperone FliS [Betaproteobacteria bacterium]